MTFEGKVTAPGPGSRHWEVEIPDLGVFTQGRSEQDAYSMAADALETLIERTGFVVEVTPLARGRFVVSANDPTPLIARWLFRMRVDVGLTIRQAAKRLGSASPEAWARYESGRSSPTLEKLAELLRAIDPDSKYAIKRVNGKTPSRRKAG